MECSMGIAHAHWGCFFGGMDSKKWPLAGLGFFSISLLHLTLLAMSFFTAGVYNDCNSRTGNSNI